MNNEKPFPKVVALYGPEAARLAAVKRWQMALLSLRNVAERARREQQKQPWAAKEEK
jgi:hypothetical protein